MYFDIVDCHFLFLSSFPEFRRVVPLLQTCSMNKFVYDVSFCICLSFLSIFFI
jgi:hypothetical protein